MNILDIQDNLKNFSEDQLINEMQMPSGTAPQFLVLGEIKRRKKMRDELSARQAQNMPTVAEEAINAAGMPQGGLAQMAQAMAPQSSIAQNTGIGSLPQAAPQAPPAGAEMGMAEIMPEMMPEMMPQGMPPAMPMAEGGPLSIRTRSGNMTDQQYERFMARQGATEGMGVEGAMESSMSALNNDIAARKRFEEMNRILASGGHNDYSDQAKIDFVSEYKKLKQDNNFAAGGVLRAQQGMYMPEDPRLRALMMQESRGDPMATGSVGEIGAFQIRPETALMPGYGIKSLFPEISSEIGAGKKYRTPAEAYQANKDLIDSTLRNTQKAEGFASDYLTRAEERLGSPEAALLSYNRGISGAGKVDDPTQDPYYQGVMSFMGNDGLPSVLADRGVTAADLAQPDAEPNFMSAMGATPASQTLPIDPGLVAALAAQEDQTTPVEIGTLFGQAVMADDLGEYIVGEDGEPIYLSEDQLAGVDRNERSAPPPPPTPLAVQLTAEESAANAKAAADDSASEPPAPDSRPPWVSPPATDDTTTTPPAAGAQTQSSSDDIAAQLAKMMTFSGSDSTSGVEQEIIDLQKDLAKSREQDKWLALGQAGLALMSSTNPTLLGAVGEAGLAGVKSLKDADESYREGVIDLINARSKLSKGALTAEEAAPLLSDVLETLGETVEDKNPASPTFGEMIPKVTGTSRLELENLRDYLMPKVGYPSATQRNIQAAISATNNAS